MSKTINRRKFFKDSALSAASIVLGGSISGCTSERESYVSRYDIIHEVMKYRMIDAHCHVGLYGYPPLDANKQIDSADRLGIDFLSISCPITSRSERRPEDFKEHNNRILSAMKLYPNRFVGFFALNPFYQKESFEEIKRCADLGFAGFKGHALVKVNDPSFYPIIERLIDLNMLCYMHGEVELGLGGYREKYSEQILPERRRPNATLPENMVEAARRYPEAMFQWAHIASGDFEYICKCIKDYPNIYVDISGSNNEEKQVDFCIEQLGEDRIFFGTDNSYYQGVAHVLSSNATDAQKRKIFFDNYNNVLKKGGYHVAHQMIN